jgi:hypothetical protein
VYQQETEQVDFLVLAGEALLIVEGEERRLKQWDFRSLPAGGAARVRRIGRRPVRDPRGLVATVPGEWPVGLLHGRRRRPRLPREETQDGDRVCAVPALAADALPRRVRGACRANFQPAAMADPRKHADESRADSCSDEGRESRQRAPAYARWSSFALVTVVSADTASVHGECGTPRPGLPGEGEVGEERYEPESVASLSSAERHDLSTIIGAERRFLGRSLCETVEGADPHIARLIGKHQ